MKPVIIWVTRAQVAAAKLRIMLDQACGRETPDAIHKIANAKKKSIR